MSIGILSVEILAGFSYALQEIERRETDRLLGARLEGTAMKSNEHLGSDLLTRFAKGTVTKEERIHVIRHFLSECEQCQRSAWNAWFPDEMARLEELESILSPYTGELSASRQPRDTRRRTAVNRR